MQMTPSRRAVSALALLLAASWTAPVRADDRDPIKEAERLAKKAMEDYDSLEFDSAAATLKSAITKLRDAGKDETPAAARIYINLGVVYISLKDRSRGINQFVEAIKIDPTAQLDPERATPELQEAFEEAQKKVPQSERKQVEPTPPPPEEVSGI